MSLALVFVCTALIELYVLRRLRFDWLVVALVVSGTLLSVDYASYTDISERNYDGEAHVQYIQEEQPRAVLAAVARLARTASQTPDTAAH